MNRMEQDTAERQNTNRVGEGDPSQLQPLTDQNGSKEKYELW